MAENKLSVTALTHEFNELFQIVRTVEWFAVIYDSTLNEAREVALNEFRKEYPDPKLQLIAMTTTVRSLKGHFVFIVDGKVSEVTPTYQCPV